MWWFVVISVGSVVSVNDRAVLVVGVAMVAHFGLSGPWFRGHDGGLAIRRPGGGAAAAICVVVVVSVNRRRRRTTQS